MATNFSNEEVEVYRSFAGMEPNQKFYREDIDESECVIGGDNRPATYVNKDDTDDVICNKHRLEMTPRERRDYIKISDVPYKNPPKTAAEAIFDESDDESGDEDFELTDEEASAALLPPS